MKKVLLFGLTILLLFSLASCITDFDLAGYKITAKAEIENYVAESNYSIENWSIVCGIVEAGKIAVDNAENKTGVDMAVATTKAEINEVNETILKQGFYTTDGEMHSIRLYDENKFSLHISYISHLPAGTYRVKNGKLMLKYSEIDELVFEIINDELVFMGTNKDGVFMKEGLVKVGTVFKKSFVEVETDGMVNCSKFFYSATMSSLGYPIELQNSDENAVFECVVNNGSFSHSDEVKTITVKPGEGFYWRNTDDTNNDERIFVEVFLRSGDNIIGYALVEIYQYNEPHIYRAKLLKSSFLPKIDGEYQQITQEQVKAAIEQAKSAE